MSSSNNERGGPSPLEFAKSITNSFYYQDKKASLKHLQFDATSHFSVLFQMHGSVWPKVMPYCIINILLTYLIYYLAAVKDVDLTFDSSGHTFMSTMVAFLVVSRAQIIYARFMEARGYLSTLYRCCRELVQHLAVLTMQETGVAAKKWRQEVSFRTIVLLRSTMAVLEYQSSQQSAWEMSDIPLLERNEMREDIGHDANSRPMRWAHGTRSLSDDNFRVPIILAFKLRKEILIQRNGASLQERMHVNEELKILSYVNEYLAAFHGLKQLITTDYPFPLVQMARTFLFFWVFTLPFVLVNKRDPIQTMLISFFTTYGFIGLEYVSMELDDPFGDDPNDFDDLGMAQMVFEDIYITLYKLDGEKYAAGLRERVVGKFDEYTEGDQMKTVLSDDFLFNSYQSTGKIAEFGL